MEAPFAHTTFETPTSQVSGCKCNRVSRSQTTADMQSVRFLRFSFQSAAPNSSPSAEHDTSQLKVGFYKHIFLCSNQGSFEISILMIWFEENKTRAFPRQKWHLNLDFLISNGSFYLLYHILILLKLFEDLRHTQKTKGKKLLNKKVCKSHSKS